MFGVTCARCNCSYSVALDQSHCLLVFLAQLVASLRQWRFVRTVSTRFLLHGLLRICSLRVCAEFIGMRTLLATPGKCGLPQQAARIATRRKALRARLVRPGHYPCNGRGGVCWRSATGGVGVSPCLHTRKPTFAKASCRSSPSGPWAPTERTRTATRSGRLLWTESQTCRSPRRTRQSWWEWPR
jgi:hypothetical protein